MWISSKPGFLPLILKTPASENLWQEKAESNKPQINAE
jgi:hypothetical protein